MNAMFFATPTATLLAGMATAILGTGSVHAAISAKSDFAVDSDGWVLFGDSTTSLPTFVTTGGNPGGFVRGFDRTVGGVWYWQAPAKFLGDRSASYGETLSFDLRMRGSGPLFDSPDVSLTGGAVTVHIDLAPVPQDALWTSYSVLLDPAAGWKVGSLAGPAATETQLRDVLGSLSALHIRGEFITGPDNGDLDNVVLTAVPEPENYTLMGAGLVVVAWMTRRRRASSR